MRHEGRRGGGELTWGDSNARTSLSECGFSGEFEVNRVISGNWYFLGSTCERARLNVS